MKKVWIFLGLTILAAPFVSHSGIELPEAKPTQQKVSSGGETFDSSASAYHIRCWQYGRLVIEQDRIEVSNRSPAYAPVMDAMEQGQSLVYLVESGSSPCLIKRSEPKNPAVGSEQS